MKTHEHGWWGWIRIFGDQNRWAGFLGHEETNVLLITNSYVCTGGKPLSDLLLWGNAKSRTREMLKNGERRRATILFCHYCILAFTFEARPCYIPRWNGKKIYEEHGEKIIILKYWLKILSINIIRTLVSIKCWHHLLLMLSMKKKASITCTLISRRSKFQMFKKRWNFTILWSKSLHRTRMITQEFIHYI